MKNKWILGLGLVVAILLFAQYGMAKEIIPFFGKSTNEYKFGVNTVKVREYLGIDKIQLECTLKKGDGRLEGDYGLQWLNEYNQLFTEGAKQYTDRAALEIQWKHKWNMAIIRNQLTLGIDGTQNYTEGWGTGAIRWKE